MAQHYVNVDKWRTESTAEFTARMQRLREETAKYRQSQTLSEKQQLARALYNKFVMYGELIGFVPAPPTNIDYYSQINYGLVGVQFADGSTCSMAPAVLRVISDKQEIEDRYLMHALGAIGKTSRS